MLDNIDKKNPFIVPENYFEDVNKVIMSNIPEERVRIKILQNWKKVTPWAVAAMFLGVVVSLTILTKSDSELANNYVQKGVVEDASQSVLLSSDENEFLLYLEDEALRSSYTEALFSEDNF